MWNVHSRHKCWKHQQVCNTLVVTLMSEVLQLSANTLVLSWRVIGRPPHGVSRQWPVVVRYGMWHATGASLSSWFLKAAGLSCSTTTADSWRGKSHPTHLYTLCGHVLSSVQEAKYLGITLTDELSWSSHVRLMALSNLSPTRGFDFAYWKIVKFIFQH